jgi:hypothetical protein
MIENAIYAKLATVLESTCDDRIYPVIADENTEQPFCIYTCEMTESVWNNNGPTNTYTYDVQVEAYSTTFATVQEIASQLQSLDGWHSGTIWQCVLTSAKPVPLEFGYGYVLSFKVWERT